MKWQASSGYEYDADDYLTDFKAYVAKVSELGKKYTVTFDTNGGSSVAAQTVESGGTATAPATAPTRAGYTFGGWYSDAKFTKKYDFSTAVTANTTLYAKWDAIVITSLDKAADVSTPAGVEPTGQLPKQVTAHYSDGSTKNVDVTWNPIAKKDYATADTSFTVNGTVKGTDKQATVTVNVTAAVPQSAVATQSSISTIATHAPDLQKVMATVTYSDGTSGKADVQWDAVAPEQYVSENADGFTVNGTVTAGDRTFTVSVKVIVTARVIKSVTAPEAQTVESGVEPTYPATVAVTYNDGQTGTANVTWTKLAKSQYAKRDGGTFAVKGTVDGYAKGVSFTVNVNPATVKTVTPSATTAQTVVGQTPNLSGITATVAYSNGDTEPADIAWEKTTVDQFAKSGVTVPVKGSVTVAGTRHDVTVNVTVVDATVTKVTSPQPAAGADANVTVDSGTSPESAISALKATVAWSNGTTTQEAATWDEPAKADYANRKGGTFTVNGKVTIAGKDYPVKATYKVNPAVAQKAEPTGGAAQITVEAGTDPADKLAKNAKVTWSNGETTTSPIAWDATSYGENDWKARAGKTFTVKGKAEGLDVAATVKVNPAKITKVHDLAAVTTEAKSDPTGKLPKTVKTDWSNGETNVALPITWNAIAADKYAKRGSFEATGKATDAVTGKSVDVKATVKVTAKAESAASLTAVTVDSGTDPFDKLPKNVKITYTDGETKDADITWDRDSYTKDDYARRAGGSFTVKGKAEGFDVTVTVKVNPATVKSVDTKDVTVGTKVGVQPTLPKTTTVTWSNGDVENAAIDWATIPADKLDQAGSFGIEGTVNAGGKDYTIKATITVTAKTVTSVDRTAKVSTVAGKAPILPNTVPAHWSDGTVTAAAVTWDDVPAAKYAKAGTFSVKGTATVNGTDYEVTAIVTVTAAEKPAPAPGPDHNDGTDKDKNNGNSNHTNQGGENNNGTDKDKNSTNSNKNVNNNKNTNKLLSRTGSNIAIIAVIAVVLAAAAVVLIVLAKRRK